VKIAFDASVISPRGAGVARWARYLLCALLQVDRRNSYHLFGGKRQLYEVMKEAGFPSNARVHGTFSGGRGGMLRSAWRQIVFPLSLKRLKPDVCFYPDHIVAFRPKGLTSVLTVYDLSFLRYGHFFRKARRIYKAEALKRSLFLADAVICVSQFTRSELENFFPDLKEKLYLVRGGVGEEFTPSVDRELVEAVRSRHNLSGPFILSVGTLEPRKNLVRLVEAFALLKKRPRLVHRLAIVGPRGWLYRDLFRKVESLNLKDEVLFTGYVENRELAALYNAADLFVYPSIYEGFGLPPLEAMACGIPVVTSKTSSLPEIVGDAAVMVDPYDIGALAEAMNAVLSRAELRNELREKGLSRSRIFRWERAARETLLVLEEASRASVASRAKCSPTGSSERSIRSVS